MLHHILQTQQKKKEIKTRTTILSTKQEHQKKVSHVDKEINKKTGKKLFQVLRDQLKGQSLSPPSINRWRKDGVSKGITMSLKIQ